MDFSVWLAFVAASTALVLIPGPTVMLVLSYALARGRRVAVATAAGVGLGDLVAMSASLAGLGALVMTSALAFTVLKWVGAVYLVWLGFKILRSPVAAEFATDAGEERGTFWHAAAVTALNPKSIAFFIAFVPQFIDPARALGPQFAILITTFVTIGALNALAYALLADRLRARLRHQGVRRWLNRLGGGTLMGMGALTAAASRA